MIKLLMTTLISLGAFASEYTYITIGADAVQTNLKSTPYFNVIKADNEVALVKVKNEDIESISKLMHDKFRRCGGFVAHETQKEALKTFKQNELRRTIKSMPFVDYTITKNDMVKSLVTEVKESNIKEVIEKLSSFHNRYYKAQSGVDSQAWIKKKWEDLSTLRSDVKVEYFKHSAWPQPSVIMTIEGSSKADEIVVIGGHADSIAGYWARERARAPGADDNASGIATITEIIKIAMENNYKPQRTIKFMAYAAEEVGLRGSSEIAKTYKKEGKNVVGVVQFDMTNHKGTDDLDIVFMTDYTNEAQTKFMGKLINTYVDGVKWGYSKCGYGCSDHASWHNNGFPASMPFESTMGDINKHIHTKNDLIERSGGNADHAAKFAKLGVAFLVEMGK
ncbi:MAG: M28 family metallopeptidase [Bacteriovoracaceae bacterium]|nr:M28 family metallopeptidase [Bacteriovoracaceae bacterium]